MFSSYFCKGKRDTRLCLGGCIKRAIGYGVLHGPRGAGTRSRTGRERGRHAARAPSRGEPGSYDGRFSFGPLTLLPISLWWDGVPRFNLSLQGWLSVLILGAACSATTTALWNWGLTHFPAVRAGVYLNLEPLVGMILGLTVLQEPLTPIAVVGGILILGAAVFLSR